MRELLQHIPPDELFLLGVIVGVWWLERRGDRSRRAQGERLGALEKAVALLRGARGKRAGDAE